MESGPNRIKKLKIEGISHDNGPDKLDAHWLDTHIKSIKLKNPDKMGHAGNSLISTIKARNLLHRVRHDNTLFGAYFLPVKLLLLGAAKAYKKQWDLGPDEGLTSISVKGALFEQQLLKLVAAIDPSVQKNITLNRMGFNVPSFKALINKLSNHPIDKLDLTDCPLDKLVNEQDESLLVKAITNNQLQAKHLVLNNTQLNESQVTSFIAALETNYHIEAIDINAAETEQQHKKITELLKRNKWLNRIQEENPHDVLNLRGEKMADWQFKALTPLIEQGRFRKIDAGQGKPSLESVHQWLKALRDNPSLTRLSYNGTGADDAANHKVQRQINANRTIGKVFGKGNPLWSRSALMFGLVGGNFLYTVAAAIVPPYAMIVGAVGFAFFGGLRVAANAYFHHNIKATKQENYWQDPSHQDKNDVGRESTKSFAPWFNYKAWTTPGYMGSIQEKNHWAPAVHDSERPKLK